MRSDTVVHVHFNLNREIHKKAYDAIRQVDRSIYPTYADIISVALLQYLSDEEDNQAATSRLQASDLSDDDAEKIAELVAKKVLEALSGANTTLPAADAKAVNRDASEEAKQENAADAGLPAGQDYIPDDEIPWDFLNP